MCGKAWWYGRDVPKVEILLQSQRPTTFGKDHKRSLQIFCCNHVSMSCLPRMFSSIDSSNRESVCGKASWYGGDLPKLENYFIAMIIEDHDKLRQ